MVVAVTPRNDAVRGAFDDDAVAREHWLERMRAALADPDVFAHDCERAHGAALSECRGGRDAGHRMNARCGPRRLIEERQRAREIQVGVIGHQAGDLDQAFEGAGGQQVGAKPPDVAPPDKQIAQAQTERVIERCGVGHGFKPST